MDNPFKVIHKVKNFKGKYQYHINIFIGIVPKNVMDALKKIENLSLQDALTELPLNQYNILVKKYGEKWYVSFYNTYHISYSMYNIKNDKKISNELIKKFGKEWFNEHVEIFKKKQSREMMSYEEIYNEELYKKEIKKTNAFEGDLEEMPDYKLSRESMKQEGGFEEDYEEPMEDPIEEAGIISTETPEPLESFETPVEEQEEMTEEELEQMYNEMHADAKKNIKDMKVINELIEFQNTDENKLFVKFDESKNENIYDESLKDVFTKKYVTSNYIYGDDTIEVIKQKIFCSIKNSIKFGENNFLPPSRQYLWSEYLLKTEKKYLTLGHQWVQGHELLKVDAVPSENIKVYEELRDNMKKLKFDLGRHGSRIMFSDDSTNILEDYSEFITNNELYMIDIYNELGLHYSPSPEELDNLQETFLRIYFHFTKKVEHKQIISYLNQADNQEGLYMVNLYESLKADRMTENEIMFTVDKEKVPSGKDEIIKDYSITQSIIHVNVSSAFNKDYKKKIDLLQLFNDVVPTEKYPFIQLVTEAGYIMFKFNEEVMNKYLENPVNANMIVRWFENAPNGISFKIQISDEEFRFVSINLNEHGKIDYKTLWKEELHATIESINATFDNVRDLIKMLNQISPELKLTIPTDYDFKYAFINVISKIDLGKDTVINHNDLANFARFFYPYASIVVLPKKRASKIKSDEDIGKSGTYLRYRRISKYDDIRKIEQRIIYFMKNYEFVDTTIVDEIAIQFNLTNEKAGEIIKNVLRTRNIVPIKKPKKYVRDKRYKSPGISIEIQGKEPDKYKMRLAGVRNMEQLRRITNFLQTMFYMYKEIYIEHNPMGKEILKKLSQLTKIARRRQRVVEFVKRDDEEKRGMRHIEEQDKRRLSSEFFKSRIKWKRVCQNSGVSNRRRPNLIRDINTLLEQGYALNKSTGMYERHLIGKSGKKDDTILKAVKVNDFDDAGNPTGNEIFYTCSPENNGIHMYIGYLSQNKNRFGEYMPCCFKKDQTLSLKKQKLFSPKTEGDLEDEDDTHVTGGKIYLVQDSNKIRAGRFGILPKYVDIFMNHMFGNTKIIEERHLTVSTTGYFLKYGVKHDTNQFLESIAAALNTDINSIMTDLIRTLKEDTDNKLFISLNNGNIKSVYKTREKYIHSLKNISLIEPQNIWHALTISHVISENGINIIIFEGVARDINEQSKSVKKDKYYIQCVNSEETNNIFKPERETIILIHDQDRYFPVFLLTKEVKEMNEFSVLKTFSYEKNPRNIIDYLSEFYLKNCTSKDIKNFVDNRSFITAKDLYEDLVNLNHDEFKPVSQYVDLQNKCRFLITSKNYIFPVSASGSLYNLNIITKLENPKYSKAVDYIEKLKKLLNKEKYENYYKIRGVSGNKHDSQIEVNVLMFNDRDFLHVVPEVIDINKLKDLEIKYDSLLELSDQEKGNTDVRIGKVNHTNYLIEHYELFKYNFSDYINSRELSSTRNDIIKITESNNDKQWKKDKLSKKIFKLIDENILQLYIKTFGELAPPNQDGGKAPFAKIVEDIPDASNYELNNIRTSCANLNKKECVANLHCSYEGNSCVFAMTQNMAIEYVGRLCSELINNEIKRKEVLHIDNYYLTKMIDKMKFTEYKGQRIVMGTSSMINSMLSQLLESNELNMPKKKKLTKIQEQDMKKLKMENNWSDFGNMFIQSIYPQNTLLRAYSNSYYWIKNKFMELSNRNLGYFDFIQTDIMTYLKSIVIDWMMDKTNKRILCDTLNLKDSKCSSNDLAVKYIARNNINEYWLIELMALYNVHKIPIVMYNKANAIFQVYDGKVIIDKLDKYKNDDYINLKVTFRQPATVPNSIEVVYLKTNAK